MVNEARNLYQKGIIELYGDDLDMIQFNMSLNQETELINLTKTPVTMSESKNLYSTIKTELETVKPVTESVVEKISNAPQTSTSQEVLAESKAYENPQFKRMKDLMAKIK